MKQTVTAMQQFLLHFEIFRWDSIHLGETSSQILSERCVGGYRKCTDHKKAEATYGKDPKETAVGTAALTVEKPDAALTFLNEKARYDKFSHTDCIKNTIPLLFS